MDIYGLTGGSGAGKSAAAQIFTQFGWGWVDADAVYREHCIAGSPLLAALAEAFPDSLTPAGTLNRPALARQVFADPAKLAQLNALTRPYIWQASQEQFAVWQQRGVTQILYDAPTLFESGLAEYCVGVIGVIAPWEVRLSRIMARDGLSQAQAQARLRAQPDEAFYRAHCDWILENNGDLEALQAQIQSWLAQERSLKHGTML